MLFASAEIAIPSLYEGSRLPAVEAMASGTPIVASRAGALPEVLGPDGECADLVAPGDVIELDPRARPAVVVPERRHWLGTAGAVVRSTCSARSRWPHRPCGSEQAIARTGRVRSTIEAVDEPC